MARRCTVCDHPDVNEVNTAILEGIPNRTIAAQFGLKTSSVFRHKCKHLPKALVQAKKAREAAAADSLLTSVYNLQTRAERILIKAEKGGDHRIALSAIRELRSTVELLAKLAGELQDGTTVNVLVSPEYTELRSTLLNALAPYPDARIAVAEALEGMQNVGT